MGTRGRVTGANTVGRCNVYIMLSSTVTTDWVSTLINKNQPTLALYSYMDKVDDADDRIFLTSGGVSNQAPRSSHVRNL